MPAYFTTESHIPVIASFDAESHIKPLYVRINGQSFKVYNSVELDSPFSFRKFQCEIEDNGYVKPLILLFHIGDQLWSIGK